MSKSNYAKLKKIWYGKLKKSGFKDIEVNENLFNNAAAFSKINAHGQHSDTWRKSKEEYYRMAEYFLNHYKFETTLDKVIWEYHVAGLGSTAIAPILNKIKIYRIVFTYSSVWSVINRLRRIMIIGAYEENE